MNILSAENNFRDGLAALVAGSPEEASTLFENAMRAEKRHKVTKPQMRYLSSFGLSVAMSRGGRCRDALRACETAVHNEHYNADLLFNLGKVYLLAGRTSKAMTVFAKGLKLDSNHRGIRAAMDNGDRRKRPPIGWLKRSHPVNSFLGRIRS
jgi:Tfp pilus assembly protein PilF